jgi:hypothetical protein
MGITSEDDIKHTVPNEVWSAGVESTPVLVSYEALLEDESWDEDLFEDPIGSVSSKPANSSKVLY